MNQDEPLTSGALAALQARFQQQSRKAQAYYTVMHAVRGVLGNDEAASSWMEAPLAAFEGETPAQRVAAGRESEVMEYVRGLKPGK